MTSFEEWLAFAADGGHDARLPTEAEWEVATPGVAGLRGQLAPDRFHRRCCPVEGSVGEYDGRFTSDQRLLRNAGCGSAAGLRLVRR